MKYINLEFSNAKVFRNQKPEDVINVKGIYQKRKKFQNYFIEPITVYQISNLIHVLMGERPIPSLRDVKYPEVYKRNEKYFQKALESYLKINSIKFIDNKGEEKYVYESLQLRKGVRNSFSKDISTINWERVRLFLEYEEYFDFLKKELSSYFKVNDITKLSFNKVKNKILEDMMSLNKVDDIKKLKDFCLVETERIKLNNEKKEEFNQSETDGDKKTTKEVAKHPEELKNMIEVFLGVKPLFKKGDPNFSYDNDYFISGKTALMNLLFLNSVDFNKFYRRNEPLCTPRLVQKYLETDVLNLSGEIIIPLEEDEVEQMRFKNCHGSFLDGGFVSVKKLSSGYDLSLNGFKKVSEISTETKRFS